MGFKFGKAAAAAAAASVVMVGGVALAHDISQLPDTPAGKAIAQRHQNFKQLGGAFKAIFDEIKKGEPNRAVIADNAKKMNALASQEASWFPKGSGPESGLKTDAKGEIWSDPQGFAAAVQRLQQETGRLQLASTSGDMDALRQQVQATGGACKNCHDKFRVPEKH
jgi:cytochrome c556